MITIREQMLQMCEEYKKKFMLETGIELVCFPSVLPIDISLVQLRKKVIAFCNEDPLDKSSRLSELIEAKRFFCVVTESVGHTHTDIMKYLKQDRTNFYNHLNRHENLIKISPTYKERYNKFLNTLHEQETDRESDTVDV